MAEELVPTDSLPDDPVREVDHPEFPLALRGYDRVVVDAYVDRVVRLVAELEAGRSPRSAVRVALEKMGEETASILHRAHEAADELTSSAQAEAERLTSSSRTQAEDLTRRSQAEADARRAEAERAAAQIVAEAQGRVDDLDRDADVIWQERARIITDVHRLSADLERVATAADQRMPGTPDAGETVEMEAAELPVSQPLEEVQAA